LPTTVKPEPLEDTARLILLSTGEPNLLLSAALCWLPRMQTERIFVANKLIV
jgi:hypothetical protein